MATHTLINSANGTITIDSDPLLESESHDINVEQTVNDHKFLGESWVNRGKGMLSVSFSTSGAASPEAVANLMAAILAGSVPITVQVGTAAGATDGGVFSGTFIISNFTPSGASGDSDRQFTFNAQSDGEVTYTPPGS